MTGYKTVVGMVKGMMEEMNITVPVALHLDHGSYEGCLKCASRQVSPPSCSTVLIIRSKRTLQRPRSWLRSAHEHGMSLEAEVGSIGGEEDGVIGMGEVRRSERVQDDC